MKPRGIARLETSGGGRYWCAAYSGSNGERRRKIVGRVDRLSRREARSELVGLIKQHGAEPGLADRYAPVALSAWCARYLELRAGLEPGSLALLQRTIALLAEFFPRDPRVDRITSDQAAAFVAALQTRESARGGVLSPATVGLHLRNARAIFAAAGSSAFAGVKAPRSHPAGWEMVTLEGFGRILEVLPDHPWRCLFGLCRLAGTRLGLRGGEALGLRWPGVVWDRWELTVDDVKRHRTRTVPIQPALYTILRDAFEAAEPGAELELVCPVRHSELDPGARRFYRLAGLGEVSKPYHGLRKSCESELLCRFPIHVVCDWLGNSTKVALKHYAQAGPEHVAAMTGRTAGATSTPALVP